MDNISTYIFIDNLSDYKFFQNKFNKEGTIWVSSSPHVLQKVKRENKQVINLESFINKGQINFLMKLSYKISEKIILKNSSKIKFINKKDYKILFYRDLAGMIGSYLYKFFALSNLIKKKKKSNFVFIGNIIEKKEVDHLMSPNDNVIFDIAKKLNNKNFKFINSISEKKKFFSFRLIILSKIISILNLNFNSFFYKLYKKFYFKIYNLKKKNIYIFKEVDNFQNNFFKIKKNFNIHFIDFKINKLKFISNKEKNNLLIENINNFVVHNLKKKNDISEIDFSPVNSVIIFKHLQVMKNFKINLNKINYEISTVSKNLKRGSIILSNILERPLSLYFFLKLRKKVKFAFFEHGETSGYQKCWDIRKNSQPTILGNFAFFTHQHGLNTHKNILPKNVITSVSGADYKYFIKKNFFKKIIVKLILGIPLFKKNVVYLADLFRNNSTMVPYIGRDLDVYEDTCKIINYLKEHHKKKSIILKQYPTSLYKDDFLINLDGAKTLSIFNWMHIYYVFDEVYFSAIQSSWLYKNQWQKIFLINRSNYPIHMKFIKSKKKIQSNLGNKIQLYKVRKIANNIDNGCWINLINQ